MCFLIIFLILGTFQPSQRQRKAPNILEKTDPASLAIRQDALVTADQAIDEISRVEDLRSRVVLAEQVVRLLSKVRPERCQKLLDTIFDDAVAMKRNSLKPKSGPADLDSIISKVIQAATLIDVELARRYVEELSEFGPADVPSRRTSGSSLAYLKIATELTKSSPSLAVSLARRSLGEGLTSEILVFLASLREHDVGIANRFFLEALQSCHDRGGKNVNELLLLYAYVFSPVTVPSVSQGIAVLSIPGYAEVAKSYPIDRALARQYLESLALILLDPGRYVPANIKTLTLGIEGDFYVLSIVEPLAAAFLPTRTSAISTQRHAVAAYLQTNQREAAVSSADRWKNLPKDSGLASGVKKETIEYLIDRAESASDRKRKDQLYFRAALIAVKLSRYETASTLVEKMSSKHSDMAKQFLRFDMALHQVRNQRLFDADKNARMDDNLPRRAYILTLIADYLTDKETNDPSRALQYLEEVQQLIGKLSNEKERLAVLIGAGNIYARLDTARASEILQQAITHANKLQDFAGDVSISNVLDIGGFYFDYSIFSNGLTMFDLINRLAPVSYYGTLQDVRSLKDHTLRLRAIMALCRAILVTENSHKRELRV